jgi:hypothetical protein
MTLAKLVTAGLCISAVLAQPAAAADPTVSAEDLIAHTDRYLNQPISFKGAYCYQAKRGYECRTNAPLRLSTDKLPDGAAKTAIDNECGELDGLELSPGCSFTLQMVPTESTTMEGDYIRDGQRVPGRITVVTVTVVSAKKE